MQMLPSWGSTHWEYNALCSAGRETAQSVRHIPFIAGNINHRALQYETRKILRMDIGVQTRFNCASGKSATDVSCNSEYGTVKRANDPRAIETRGSKNVEGAAQAGEWF